MFNYLINNPKIMNNVQIVNTGFFILYSLLFVVYNAVMEMPYKSAFHAGALGFFVVFFVGALKYRKALALRAKNKSNV